jgi:hypothetical protein
MPDTAQPTTVVSVRHREPFDLYIGRRAGRFYASIWGNPFRPSDNDRDDAIQRYRGYLLGRADLLARLPELKGKRLACWCAPKGGVTAADTPYVCHGQVLAELADATADGPMADVLSKADGQAARYDAFLAAARAEPHIAADHTCMRAGDHCAACEEFDGALIEIEKRDRGRIR